MNHRTPNTTGSLCLAAWIALGAAPGLAASTEEGVLAESVRAAVDRVSDSLVRLQPIGGGDPLSADGAAKPTTGLIVPPEFAGDDTDPATLIVTSSYGFDPAPESILVRYRDATRASATLLAIDHSRRIALLRASRPPNDPPPPLAFVDKPRVGETAIAVGRTLAAERPNVAVGIISAVNRLHGRAVQTDAAASPANYGGPLIDLRGRVTGLLTPLAPASVSGDGAGGGGVGWYDSGVGFAAPAPAVLARIDRLRRGESIRPGLAGLAFAPGNVYLSEPRLLTVHPGGPADRAGLRADDLIVEANGRAVQTPNDFRFATATLDDAARLDVVARRGEQTVSASLELVAELSPYRHTGLGLIAGRRRDETSEKEKPDGGVLLTEVLAGGPAAEAGVKPGDRLLRLNGKTVATRDDAAEVLAATTTNETARLVVQRWAEELELTATLQPCALGSPAVDILETEPTEEELVVPGTERRCAVHKPVGEQRRWPALIWLGGGFIGGDDRAVSALAKRGCLVVVPEQAGDDATAESERAFLVDLLSEVGSRTDVDPLRLAVGAAGRRGPRRLAVALSLRDRVPGIILRGWPRRPPAVKPNTPSHRVGVLLLGGAARDGALAKRLDSQGYPVHQTAESPLNATAAWLTGLDRF